MNESAFALGRFRRKKVIYILGGVVHDANTAINSNGNCRAPKANNK